MEGEIVNADSLQAYRGFDIGTAKPTAEEQTRVRHHLIDILEPSERWSAGEFARSARAAIVEIQSRGKRPLVVGGSGLYFRALVSGLAPMPPGDENVRAELVARLETEGLATLYAELRTLDPITAERLPIRDTQRILRALEVALVSGRPLSEWIADRPFGTDPSPLPMIAIGLTLPRSVLYDRVASRVARMVERGWVQEVASLLARGFAPSLPAFQAIGYRQLALHVRGEWPLERALEETVRATRRFAKRQETWFRKEPAVTWFSNGDLERRIVPHIFERA